MPEILTDAYLLFTFVFKQALSFSAKLQKKFRRDTFFNNFIEVGQARGKSLRKGICVCRGFFVTLR